MRILCLGDSIMQYNDWTSYPQTGWVQLLDRFFVPGTEILNFARNGRSSKSFITEGRFEKVLDAAQSGDFALIQFAHNDEKINDSQRYSSAEKGGEFRKNLALMVQKLQEKGVKPILLTPVTRRKFVSEHKIENTHGLYPQAVSETAAELNVPCIDLTDLTTRYFEKAGENASKNFFMNFGGGIYENYPEGKTDDSHLRCNGAYAVCRLFVGALLKLKNLWKDYSEIFDGLCTKGIYSDREIDDEKIFW
ncbi:MAG: rhamnogalacturonan acetylesterase [Spirochaetia bacterium]|nr:rhamnogalacturonan acetylesterase [Spirochaetia bacterium]